MHKLVWSEFEEAVCTGGEHGREMFEGLSNHFPVYARPAPAVNLADLVPQQVNIRQAIAALENHEYCTTPASGYKAGVKDTRAAILRKIEETK